MKHLLLAITLLTVSGCLRMMPSRITVDIPHSYEVNAALSAELHTAMHQVVAHLPGRIARVKTKVVSFSYDDALHGTHNMPFGSDVTLRVAVQCYDESDTLLCDETVEQTRRVCKPNEQSSYPYVFAEARRKICYDVARHVERLVKAAA